MSEATNENTQIAANAGGTGQAVAEILAGVLKTDTLAADEDFFRVGGNSMTATLATYRLRDEFGIDVPLLLIFEHPTPEELSRAIEKLLSEQD